MTKIYYPSNVERYRSLAEKYSKEYLVPVDVILGTIQKESAGNPKAWNPQNNENSRGLMQISEPTAISHPAIKVPFLLLDTLYDPEDNIRAGSALLQWIYNFLNPYFPKYVDEKLKWMVVSSSYNQGHGYYRNALQSLDKEKRPVTWNNILDRVLNPIPSGRTPWVNSAKTYGPSIIDGIPTILLKPVKNPAKFFSTPRQGSALVNSQSLVGPLHFILLAGSLGALGYLVYTDKSLMKKLGVA